MRDLLTILLLASHLLSMNVAAGGPLVCMGLEWRSRKEPLAGQAADYLARWSVLSLVGGTLLGLLLGLVLWNEDYHRLWLARLSHKMNWGIVELVFSLVLLGAYWGWRGMRAGSGTGTAVARIVLLLVASSNLIYHFPPLFVVAGRLADAGEVSSEPVTPALFRQEMVRGEVPSLASHFLLASLAIAGMMLLGLALRLKRRGGSDEDYSRLARWGGWIATIPTVLQLAVGLWVLTALPAGMQSRLMGSNALATTCFLAALAASLWLMRELVAIALGEQERRQLVRAMAIMVAVVLLMTAGQHYARARKQPDATGIGVRRPVAALTTAIQP